MKLLPCGDSAVLLDCASLDEARKWHDALADSYESVLGARSVLVHGSPPELRRIVSQTTPRSAPTFDDRLVRIPVRYDGPDLADVAEHTGLDTEAIIEAHTGGEWEVAFAGFAPGFAYLSGGDSRLTVPRRARPRQRIDGGSVGLAGGFTAVYPRESPGGWQIIGHTDMTMFDAERDPPALLQPGMRVRFEDVS